MDRSNSDQVSSFRGEAHSLEDRVRSGDLTALAELFELYRPRLSRIVDARMDMRLRGRVDPTDILQETFLELSRKLPKFVDKVAGMSLFVWMRMVAVERTIVAYRHHLDVAARDVRREAANAAMENSGGLLVDGLVARFSTIGRKAIREEMAETLQRTLQEMQPIDHEIITMRCFEELSNAEAAQSLGISENGASSRFVRAMTRLKTELCGIPEFEDA